ncbi:PmoA family protein [Kordiimonas aestuarii]|uniref:PmoA family protein n=1 Tax=Kordiimonas aestuarii TaxID=1005925 RepID=UPI0021D1208E|nr:PmoA family protein [Kordiimonas aestuarii]
MMKTLSTLAALIPLSFPLACEKEGKAPLNVIGTESHIDISDNRGPILRYQISPPNRAEPWRANYLHPLFAPSGTIITENAPADHIHHRGIFWSWRGLFIGGESVGDAWVGDHITYVPVGRSYGDRSDGSVEINTSTLWRTDATDTPTDFLREDTTVTVAASGDRLHLRVALTALVPNVSIAGSDNEKGYGGLSFRFGRADKMDIVSDGNALVATPAARTTGDEVEFHFQAPPPGWPHSITIACEVDGKPWHSWVLRQEQSMQNCAWPGRTPSMIPANRPVVLSATIRVQ